MSQFDLAFLLLIAGVLVGLRARANLFGMACMVPIVVAAVYVHGRLGGDDLARLMLHSAEGVVIFGVGYLIGDPGFILRCADETAPPTHEPLD